MIISTPDELRLYLPTHVLDDISNVAGAIDNSVHDFLRERLGAPLLAAVEAYYASHYLDEDGNPDTEAITADLLSVVTEPSNPMPALIRLCQRCVVFDAFARMADIQTLSVHDAGINVVETKGYDAAPDKTVANYKAQMIKEAHAASNRLLIWLEESQQSVLNAAATSAAADSDTDNDSDADAEVATSSASDSADDEADTSSAESESEAEVSASTASDSEPTLPTIVQLWQQSSYYYYADGLLFNTATEFGLFVNIYDSREKFIQLLPDIRYCQETHLEAELGEALLQDLIDKHKAGSLSAVEAKAYQKLQRGLSLMVEARSSLFKRAEAKDEADGQMRLALDYIRRNASSFNEEAYKASPLYVPTPDEVATSSSAAPVAPPHPAPHNPDVPGWPSADGFHRYNDHSDGMLISSMI